ncbi:MAG: hypothetical protein AB7D27_18025, partial [Desulfomicrobium sp.]
SNGLSGIVEPRPFWYPQAGKLATEEVKFMQGACRSSPGSELRHALAWWVEFYNTQAATLRR